ncbi:MAG: preprotein translocase subunit SecG [Ruminococcaceae bacterium]|nr:preprotein translocase subunit SecG [Oscillospiraceae bacterium]
MVAQYIIGSILMAVSVALVIVILSQTGKDNSLSGTIAGGSSDTYFGKTGGSTKEQLLSKVTIVLSAVFVVLAVTLMIIAAK